MSTCTREQFTAAIEAGIAAADFPEDAQAKLRVVAQTAASTAIGSRTFRGAACPLEAAGLWHANPRKTASFWSAFDAYMGDLDNYTSLLFKVVG